MRVNVLYIWRSLSLRKQQSSGLSQKLWLINTEFIPNINLTVSYTKQIYGFLVIPKIR